MIIPRTPPSLLGQLKLSWINTFRECETIEELNSIIVDISKCMLKEANKLMKSDYLLERGTDKQNTDIIKSRPHNNQSRLQQKIRRLKKQEGNKAMFIQNMFRRYPKKTVRKILGETNNKYTGNLNLLKEHATPNTELVPDDNPYLNMNWKSLDSRQNSVLQSPPTRKEITYRLKKAKNNSPGPDKLEYLHLKLIDNNGTLIEAIFAAVHQLGIPRTWKDSKTILIHNSFKFSTNKSLEHYINYIPEFSQVNLSQS